MKINLLDSNDHTRSTLQRVYCKVMPCAVFHHHRNYFSCVLIIKTNKISIEVTHPPLSPSFNVVILWHTTADINFSTLNGENMMANCMCVKEAILTFPPRIISSGGTSGG